MGGRWLRRSGNTLNGRPDCLATTLSTDRRAVLAACARLGRRCRHQALWRGFGRRERRECGNAYGNFLHDAICHVKKCHLAGMCPGVFSFLKPGATCPLGADMQGASSTRNGRSGPASLPPGFILCGARSGSTLLRLILNGHPEIACPPETNLGDAFLTIAFWVGAVSEQGHTQPEAVRASEEVRRRAAPICRDVADRVMGKHLSEVGKRMWVDKSLGSIFHAELLAHTYPDARFICLYRQCADTIASLREACGWRFDAFGVLPYVKSEPTVNLVQAFALYWTDHVSRIKSFEENNPDRTLRVRYEDLVTEPEEAVTRILTFLSARTDSAALASALAPESLSAGVMPGDLKVRFSEGIDRSSVGRGWTVPMEMLEPEVRDRVETLSHALGYPPIPNLKDCTTEPASKLLPRTSTAPRCVDVVTLLDERATQDCHRRQNGLADSSLLKLVLVDAPQPWLIDLEERCVASGDGEANWLALTDSETLMSLVSGRSNPGAALKNSTLQLVSSADRRPDDYLTCVDLLMSALRN
jgi:Sulfotransferase family